MATNHQLPSPRKERMVATSTNTGHEQFKNKCDVALRARGWDGGGNAQINQGRELIKDPRRQGCHQVSGDDQICQLGVLVKDPRRQTRQLGAIHISAGAHTGNITMSLSTRQDKTPCCPQTHKQRHLCRTQKFAVGAQAQTFVLRPWIRVLTYNRGWCSCRRSPTAG